MYSITKFSKLVKYRRRKQVGSGKRGRKKKLDVVATRIYNYFHDPKKNSPADHTKTKPFSYKKIVGFLNKGKTPVDHVTIEHVRTAIGQLVYFGLIELLFLVAASVVDE